jgi:hypothetical protein
MIDNVKYSKDTRILVLSLEDGESNKKPIEINYPNNKIAPCGDHTKGRDCTSSRKKPANNNPIKIRFATKAEKTEGDYLWDRGAIYGENGSFGWSMDMRSNIKTRSGGKNPLHKYLAEFNPSSKSRWCTKESSDVNCDNVTWTVKAGLGKFNVKVHVGDPEDNVRIDLKINDEYLIKGKTVDKGDLQVFEGNFESINELLTFNTECEEDCEYARAKINMVEIYPYLEEEETPVLIKTPEKFDPCGNSYTGGRCHEGPNVENCVYNNIADEGAKFCNGVLYFVQISEQYKCLSQKGKWKCVMRDFTNAVECAKSCPGECEKNKCIG